MDWRQFDIWKLVIAVLVIIPLIGCSQSDDDSSAESDVDALSVTTEIDLVSAEGSVVPLADAQLSFSSSGQVQEIIAEEGTAVSAGDAVLRLDTVEQEIAVAQAEAAVAQVEANVETARAGLLAAQAGLEAAQIGVLAAEAQLALVLAEPSEAQLALAEAGVGIAEAGIVQAAGNQSVVVEGGGSASIAAAEAQLVAAQTQYDAALKAYQPILQNEDITDEDVRERARLQLNAAQANLAAAQAGLREAQAGATAGERTAAAAGVNVAAQQRDASQAQLALLLSGAKEEQIAVNQSSVEQAQNAVREAELQVSVAETAVSQAEAALAETRASVAAARSALGKRTILAPFDGVVATVLVKEGQVISPGVPVVIVADMSGWQIETTDLTELSVVNIARDFEGEISLDAFPSQTLSGRVVDISSVSDLVRGDVTYKVTFSLDDTRDLPLRWGMTAFVTVETDQ